MAIEKWSVDKAHSGIHFVVRHMLISRVRGRFPDWTGTILADEQKPEASSVEVRIQAASIDTEEPKRDAHLRSADFFDVERHPEIVFRSTAVELRGEELRLTGELTMHGVTRTVRLDGERLGRGKDPWGGERMGFTARTSVDRREFGLTWNQALETGGVLVGDKVDIELEVEAVKLQETAATTA
jgi:polyisoprenoid-binding protein YceI